MGEPGDPMESKTAWSVTFAISVAWLMLLLLLVRPGPISDWTLLAYPAVGGLLAHTASRTSRTAGGIARLEIWTTAAAIVLAGAVFIDQVFHGVAIGGHLPALVEDALIATILGVGWWVLVRRFSVLRSRGEDSEARA